MNDDDYSWIKQILSQRIYGKSVDKIWVDEATDMAWSYSKGYYNDTRGDEVATAVLEAYANGIEFDTLLQKNKQVRAYWAQIQAEKIKQAQARERARERDRKLAEKRAAEKAQREEVMAKLSKEELEAFGLVKKGKK